MGGGAARQCASLASTFCASRQAVALAFRSAGRDAVVCQSAISPPRTRPVPALSLGMSRILLVCAGSRGDVEPFAALAAALAASPRHTHTLTFTQSDYIDRIPRHPSLATHALPFATADYASHFSSPPPATPAHLHAWAGLGRIIDKLILPSIPAVLGAASAAKVAIVVTSYMTRPLALVVAEKLGVPTVVVQLQPQVPTTSFPHHSDATAAAAAILESAPSPTHLSTYHVVERLLHDVYAPSLNVHRAALSLRPLTVDALLGISAGRDAAVHVVNAFPFSLVGPAADAGPNVHNVGPLADAYLPDGRASSAALDAFLAAGPPPVCVGFGSMAVAPATSRTVLAALRGAGVARAVIVGGRADVGGHQLTRAEDAALRAWAAEHTVRVTGEDVPYAWLLPQCAMMLCHGGAGVVSASLRAGVPMVVSPVLFDQFLWASLVEGRGLGVNVGSQLSRVPVGDLAEAIARAGTDEVRLACRHETARLASVASAVDKLVSLLDSLA
jgi:sterol 3beta-glucosyltransferase